MSETKQAVTIKAPDLRVAVFKIRGTAPYVQHKFSEKTFAKMQATQEAGSTAKGKKAREPRDINGDYEAATHYSTEKWCGIPAPAFRSALISACRLVGFQMTRAKLAVFALADGIDPGDGTPLVKIEGKREMHKGRARNDNGGTDLRFRPIWHEWTAELKLRFDAEMFTLDDVTNLLARAGAQVGIGEGRPDSKSSNGCGWGTFEIVAD